MPDEDPGEEMTATAVDGEPPSDPHEEEERGRWKIYLSVWTILLVFTILELAITEYMKESRTTVSMLVTLMIGKALLVVLYYMHLRYESRALRWVIAVPFGAGLFFVFIVMLV